MPDGSFALLCVWLFLDGATFSVATTPLLLLAAREHPVWQVALLGGAVSSAGSVLQLLLLRRLLAGTHPWMARFAPARARIEEACARYPSGSFLAILVARATPLPDAPLKLAAAATGYPAARYFLAILLGAVPYYGALALVGHRFRPPLWAIAALAVVLVLAFVVDHLRSRRGHGPA